MGRFLTATMLIAFISTTQAIGEAPRSTMTIAAQRSPLVTTAPPEVPPPPALESDASSSSDADGAPRGTWSPRQICAPDGDGGGWRCKNWAGTVEWAPEEVFVPATERELSQFLRAEASAPRGRGRSLRVVGFAHSWSSIFVPDGAALPAEQQKQQQQQQQALAGTGAGVTIALHKLTGITNLIPPPPAAPAGAGAGARPGDAAGGLGYVEVRAGTSFADLFKQLDALGLALLVPPGGIQGLTVGGAVSVGFHGSQSTLGGASSGVVALRVVGTDGEEHELSEGTTPGAMRAARLGLGTCGVITRVTMPVVRQFHLARRRWRLQGAERFLDGGLAPLVAEHDRFHYYVHPSTDSVWPMTWEPTTPEASAAEGRPCRTALEQREDAEEREFGPGGLPLIMRWDNCSDLSHNALTHAVDMDAQPLWNGELYLPLPAGAGAAAAAEAAAVKAVLKRFEDVAAEACRGGGVDGDGGIARCGAAADAAGGQTSAVHRDLWLHVRYVAGDDASHLNPCRGAPVCAAIELALVAHAMDGPLPPWGEWDAYFSAMQDVLLPLGGRPHAAKFHSIRPEQLPARGFGLPVDEFARECRAFDPRGAMRDAKLDALQFGGARLNAAAAHVSESTLL